MWKQNVLVIHPYHQVHGHKDYNWYIAYILNSIYTRKYPFLNTPWIAITSWNMSFSLPLLVRHEKSLHLDWRLGNTMREIWPIFILRYSALKARWQRLIAPAKVKFTGPQNCRPNVRISKGPRDNHRDAARGRACTHCNDTGPILKKIGGISLNYLYIVWISAFLWGMPPKCAIK